MVLILLYGSENWIMTELLMKTLESFQGELAKRILKWPQHHSNTAAIVALELPAMRCRILLRKLAFLQRLLRDDAVGVGAEVLHACVDDIESVCLVKEYVELEEWLDCEFVGKLLQREGICFCDSCEAPLLEHVISANYRLLWISEHSTSESILHSICNDIFSDIAHFYLLFFLACLCSTFMYACSCPLEGIDDEL